MTRVPRTTIATLLVLLVLTTGCTRAGTSTAASPAATPTADALCRNTAGAGSPLSDQGDLAAQRSKWALATQLYQSVLSSPTESAAARGCAARGLAYVANTQPSAATNEAKDTARAWDAFYADWIKPAARFGLPLLIVLLVLLTIAQLAGRIVVRPRAQGRALETASHVAWYNAAYLTAAAAMAWAGAELSMTLPLARGTALRNTDWVEAVGLALCAIEVVSLYGMFIEVGWGDSTPRRLTKSWHDALGVLTGLVAAVPLVLACVEASGSFDRSAARTAVFAALLATLSVLVYARASGLAMGLRIAGTSSDGKTDAGLAELVRVRLHALGSRPPRGIQVTEQTDVASLPPTALSLLPDGPWRQAVSALFGLFTPSSPWLVQVTEQTDSSLSVVISRNRAVVDARIIRPDVIGLPRAPKPSGDAKPADPLADWRSLALRTAAAAFVLTTLSERYRHLRLGLSGATDWRSIAAQVVATDPAVPATDDEDKTLLVRAINFDEGNLAARAALLNMSDPGIAGPLATLTAYLEELEAFALLLTSEGRPTAGNEPLYLRTLFNIAIGRLNCVALDPQSAAVLQGKTALDKTATLAAAAANSKAANDKLADGIQAQKAAKAPALDLATRMDAALPAFVATISRYENPAAAPADLGTGGTIQVRYGRACYFATMGHWEKVLEDLSLPASLPHTRAAAQVDPSFDALHDRDIATAALGSALSSPAVRFKALIGAPIGETLLDLAPFAGHRGALSDLGVHTADELLALPAHRLVLAFKIAPEAATRWHTIATMHRAMLHRAMKPPRPESDAVGTTLLLLLLDLDSPAALAAWQAAKTDEGQRKALIEAARPHAFAVPEAATLKQALADAARPSEPS